MIAKREFFTTNEVAQTLGISPFTIRRYIRIRKLKAIKLEGSYRVRQSDLEQFLKARELETEDELAALDAAEESLATAKKTTAATATRKSAAEEKRKSERAEEEPSPRSATEKKARKKSASSSSRGGVTPPTAKPVK
ncbi:MAG: helix-turn-helix domain-containing protein [Chloroflexi bacterium]|nr:helix-turn-helix domain-containing protein [Chloroflexota bacterium]